MPDYRWNVSTNAAGYDEAAHLIHPRYLEVQDVVLSQLAPLGDADFLVVDAGGGSGRLMQRILTNHPQATGIVLDQSEAFLALAERRLATFGERATCRLARLQEDWPSQLPRPPAAVVSMTAIHHLDADEKQTLFQRIFDALAPGGMFINGDEVRPTSDADYLNVLQESARHKHRLMRDGLVPESMHDILSAWEARHVTRFPEPRVSGDDCHATSAAQLAWFQACGFERTACVWHEQLWAVMVGVKKA